MRSFFCSWDLTSVQSPPWAEQHAMHSQVLMAPSFMAFRVALVVCMHFLLRNIKQVCTSAAAAAFPASA